MKLGILTCAQPPEQVTAKHGAFFQMFSALLADQGISFHDYNVEGLTFPATPAECDAWLITGARHGAYEDHAFIPPLESFIRACDAARAPMIGICFGHQIIAQAMGGKVRQHPGGWIIGRQDYQVEGLGQICLNAWHQDQVYVAPPGARTIATHVDAPFAGLRYGDHMLTLQPHPEITPRVLHDYAEWQLERDVFPPETLRAHQAQAETAPAPPDLGPWLAAFLRDALAARP